MCKGLSHHKKQTMTVTDCSHRWEFELEKLQILVPPYDVRVYDQIHKT